MAQRRGTVTPRGNKTAYRDSTYRDSTYIYGSEALDVRVRRQLEEEPRRRLSNETRKNRDKARHMSLGYVVFLMAALCTCAVVLINYVQLQATLTNKAERVASLESELNNLKLANDEEYSRITRSIDLETIKSIAIGEMGMIYATEGQIIIYDNVGTDYMRAADYTN